MSNLVNKFKALATELQNQFVDRDEVVEGMLCAALAGEHVLLLGPPGTAKSALARAFSGSVSGAEYFEWLLNRFSSPEELFGPISLKGLEADEYRRVTTGKLPEAHVAFLDEIFKSNSAILNSLLTALNERKYHNGGKPMELPLRLTIGASNELPDGAELEALYDRFLVRFWVGYTTDHNSFLQMLESAPGDSVQKISIEDWDAAREEVRQVKFDLGAAFYRLKETLAKENIHVSDRRWKRAIGLVKAQAWLNGETECDQEEMAILAHALWHDPEEKGKVAEAVNVQAGGMYHAAAQAVDAVHLAVKGVDLTPPTEPGKLHQWQTSLLAANREINRCLTSLKDLHGKSSGRSSSKIAALIKEMEKKIKPIREASKKSLDL